jgi:hypothetical protein
MKAIRTTDRLPRGLCPPSRLRPRSRRLRWARKFTEQFIVAELYAQALKEAGIKVERKINLGGTLIAHKAPGKSR